MNFLTLIMAGFVATTGAFAGSEKPMTAPVEPVAASVVAPVSTPAAPKSAALNPHKGKWAGMSKEAKDAFREEKNQPIPGLAKGNTELNDYLCFNIARFTKAANGKFKNFPEIKEIFENNASELETYRKKEVSDVDCAPKAKHPARAKAAEKAAAKVSAKASAKAAAKAAEKAAAEVAVPAPVVAAVPAAK